MLACPPTTTTTRTSTDYTISCCCCCYYYLPAMYLALQILLFIYCAKGYCYSTSYSTANQLLLLLLLLISLPLAPLYFLLRTGCYCSAASTASQLLLLLIQLQVSCCSLITLHNNIITSPYIFLAEIKRHYFSSFFSQIQLCS